MTTKAVLLCGGLATRLLPITKSIPKEMMPVLSKPAIEYCIEDLRNNGIKDILIVLGRNKEVLENYFDKNIELEQRLKDNNKLQELQSITAQYTDINVSFVRQIEAKGTGFATSLAKNFVGNDSFILLYPDEILIGHSLSKQLIDVFHNTGKCVIPLKQINIDECYKYGMVGIEKRNNLWIVNKFVEKPSIENTPSNVCYTGGGLFTSDIFNYLENLPDHNGETYLTDTFDNLIAKNNLCGIEIKGTRLDIGSPLGLIKSNILAGLSDKNLRNDLIDFIKSLEI